MIREAMLVLTLEMETEWVHPERAPRTEDSSASPFTLSRESRRCLQLTHRHTQTHTGTHGYTQAHTGTHGHTQSNFKIVLKVSIFKLKSVYMHTHVCISHQGHVIYYGSKLKKKSSHFPRDTYIGGGVHRVPGSIKKEENGLERWLGG